MNIHYTHNYLINPQHPITIALVGVGGTGSQVLTHLARINEGLLSIGHPGLQVAVYDDDKVTAANVGRQLFSTADIGQFKSNVLVSRINRYFGLNWQAFNIKYKGYPANILISCVDNYKTRVEISKMAKKKHKDLNEPYLMPYYWMDFGNGKTTGQVILGSLVKINQPASKETTIDILPTFEKVFKKSQIDKEEDNAPSCSLAEALSRQDLFINSTLANLGCNILWKMISTGYIKHRGAYLNLDTLKTNPILI